LNIKKTEQLFWKDAENRLFQLSDEKYRNFSEKLNPNIKLIGVPIPKVRKLALSYLKTADKTELMSNPPLDSFLEIKFMKAIFLSRLSLDLKTRFQLLQEFLPYLDGWAICDLLCSELKDCKQHKKDYFNFMLTLIHEKKACHVAPYITRFFCVMALMYFDEEKYVKQILEEIKTMDCEHYYVMMGVAWLLSTLYLHLGDAMLDKIKALHLDKRTHNTTIQKIIDSRTISQEKKVLLKLEKK